MKRYCWRRLPRTVPGSTGDILSFLAAHGTRDKDSAGDCPERIAPRSAERRKGGMRRMTLDLHGLTSDEASQSIRDAVASCVKRGVRELLVIHGRGLHSVINEKPVLKRLVLGMLENDRSLNVRGFRGGLPREGGEGATLIYLK
jgi:DNA-nicking Smr family endonuclease